MIKQLKRMYNRRRLKKLGGRIVKAQANNNWQLSSKLEIDRALIPQFSAPIDFSFLLSIDDRIKPVLYWLSQHNVQVRQTAPGTLWDSFGQYGCLSHDGKRTVILIDPFDKNTEDKYEFLDTLFHECVHATAPHTGRGELPRPADTLSFWKEELIAIEGSGFLGWHLGIKDIPMKKATPPHVWQLVLAEVTHTPPYAEAIRKAVTDGFDQARQAVEFILSASGVALMPCDF